MSETQGELNRLRWRCRIGLLEVDLLLTNFFEQEYLQLSEDEKNNFKELLEYPELDLFAMLKGETECLNPNIHKMVMKVRRVNNLK